MKNQPLYQATIEKTINCPQCGDSLPLHFKWTKLVQCPSCKSSIFLEDDSLKLIGKASALSPEPSLLKLGEPISIDNKTYLPLGKIRYSYGRGFWEEWFLTGEANREFWLSVDEGDFVLESKAKIVMPFKNIDRLSIGKKYGKFVVTEIGKGECVGFEGELPENIAIGKTHQYAHLSEGGTSLITAESSPNGMKIFRGNWIDPFSIKKVYG
ncbi:DUF4178 domain-containing protein [Sulfurovum sp. bin170]|uniref:DUF4178 domain-containing protein n=1 Tax=Sulfurovum sp. bin170 TaxID=2695268 RepID=UPI0013E01B93|nr:DUF4178 domain-containing protein [Sulfurovum sp. bin170]NEW60466.1 DUF4178 domain-containing protein [Sulfurovum sp. bin170]